MANTIEQTVAGISAGAKHDTDWLLDGHRRELEELDQRLLAAEITLQRGLDFVAAQRRRIREAYQSEKPDGANAPARLPPRPIPEQGRIPQRAAG